MATPWDPFADLDDLTESLSRIMTTPRLTATAKTLQRGREAITWADWSPVVDVSESNEEYLIQAELPEIKKSDVNIMVQNGALTITGERKHEEEEKGKRFHRLERSYGRFVRTFAVPADVDEKAIQADFKDGMLNIHLPKSAENGSKKIGIKIQ